MKYIFLFVISLFPFYTLLSVEPTVLQEERDSFSIKADSLFAQGVKLYQQGKLDEALSLMEESTILVKDIYGRENFNYAIVLNNWAFYLAESGNLNKAIQLMQEALIITEKTLGKEHFNYIMALDNLAFVYFKTGNNEKAIQLKKEVLIISKKVFGDKSLNYDTYLNSTALFCSQIGKVDEAIRLGKEVIAIREDLLGKKDFKYGESLYNLASYYIKSTNYKDAIRLNLEALAIFKDSLNKESTHYSLTLNNLSLCYSQIGNYKDAIKLSTEALLIRRKVSGIKHPEYATTLNNIASYYSNIGDYKEAIRLAKKALVIRKEILGKEHPDYATALNNLSLYYSESGAYSEAIQIVMEALNIQENVLGKEHPDYATSLNNLGLYYTELGDYKKAIHIEKEALAVKKKTFGEEHPDYAASLNNLAYSYHELGNYEEAIRLGMDILLIQEKCLGKEHPDYAKTLSNLSAFYATCRNYIKAIQIGETASTIYEKSLSKEHPQYAINLGNLAVYYSNLGNYEKATQLAIEALTIKKRVLGEEHPSYAISLNDLSTIYAQKNQYDEAIQLNNEALIILEKVLGKEHLDYALVLSNQGNYYYELSNYDEAIRLHTEALAIREKLLGKEHLDYALSLNNLSTTYFASGDIAKAILLNKEAAAIMEKVIGKNNKDYAQVQHNLATYYIVSGNPIEVIKAYTELTSLYINLILSTFADLTTTEQALFWNKYNDYFNNELPQRAYTLADNSLYISAYNGVLLSKGLLLNAEMEMKKLLQESEDTFIVALYDETRMNKIMLNKQLEKPIKERLLDTDSLQRLINRQEQELIQRSKVYGDYTHNLRINWQDVQNKLSKEDIALEFLSFPMDGDSIMYVAMIVKPDMAYPEMIPLFEEKQLKQVPHYAYYDTSDLYHLVWQPLEEKLQGVKNIYFAPAGELYNIAIETLPDTDSTWIFDRFNLYRLSSTRQLALIQETYDNNSTRIYGGLKYDTDLTQLIRDNQRYKTEKQSLTRSFEDCFIADSLHLRSGVEELPGTRIEAENIKHSLDAAHIENDLLTDTVGTEASFKAMSGKHIRTLHIATHGFYWTKREAYKQKRLNFLMLEDNHNLKYTEDKSLTRSGLLMAGANNALIGIEIPEEVDNGILTAKEIANLDLRGMDMVVLSACQTGLGEITGDGVFGLQRGFKKAGAKSLLMSLWKVDDNATQILMTHFYANLIAGMDKHSALCEAQRMVREYEVEKTVVVNDLSSAQKRKLEKQGQTWIAQTEVRKMRPYEHPKYWAAFILLDGINK